jgi:sortase A
MSKNIVNGSSISSQSDNNDAALDLLRSKINTIYRDEPGAKEEIQEAEAAGTRRSKHQQYMYELSTSGRSLADIQTAWHQYYIELPEAEKHEVWQEFYAQHTSSSAPRAQDNVGPKVLPPQQTPATTLNDKDKRTVADVKKQLLSNVRGNNKKLSKKHHFKSLAFGLGLGGFMILVFLFGFFNERFIAPFITPSKSVSNTPLIIDPSTTAVGPEPKIIIPKINVEIPVVYDEPSIAEASVQKALERGVLHYATTSNPGETGSGVIFGHSSNNILNKGKYKFAFVLLKKLEVGDTFIIHKDGKRYVYKVTEKKVVKPTDVSVLNPQTSTPSMTLITCDPPGTSINRLVVVGEQISPDPGTNVASSTKTDSSTEAAVLPGNAPSLWQRFKDWISS